MTNIIPVRLLSRTSSVTDWKCQRARYYANEIYGRGISKSTTSLALFTGIVLHDSLAAIATYHQRGEVVPIDTIATLAFNQIYDNLSVVPEGEMISSETEEFAKEQGSLTEGIIRGYFRHVWPRLLIQYPKIVAIEQEVEYKLEEPKTCHHCSGSSVETDENGNNEINCPMCGGLGSIGGFIFMAKPDLILEDPSGEWHYIEFKSTSYKKDSWINSWDSAVQLHSSVKAVEETMGRAPVDVTIVGMYKGYCLTPETPVLTSDLRWVTVGSLAVGDKLAAFEETSANNRSGGKSLREWREATVDATGRELMPCYEIELADGTKFTCTGEHKWLTASEFDGMGSAIWKTTETLSINKSRIVKLIEPWEGLGEFEPHDAGYLAAAFDGEGHLACHKFDRDGKGYSSLSLNFTQNPNPMMTHMEGLMSKYGITWSGNDRKGERKIQTLQIYNKIKVLSLLGKLRPKRLLPKLDFNDLGMVKFLPTRPVLVVGKKFVGLKEVVTLSTDTGTFIASGFASHNSSYGKQSSPFTYCYKKSGNPPFTQDQIEYAYKAGFKRYPTWELPGGVKKWIDDMPEQILGDQFPMTAPIFYNQDLVERFFAQRLIREVEIRNAMVDLNEHPENEQIILDTHFQQKFDVCQPSFGGYTCEYKKLCFSDVKEPLNEGFQLRDPHHERDRKQYE